VVHKTEHIRKTLSPVWKPFTVLTRTLCNGDIDRFVMILLCDVCGNFVRTTFLMSVLVSVSRDYELGTKFRLIVVYLLRKNMEIEFSAFGNFSTDTGSTDCNQVHV